MNEFTHTPWWRYLLNYIANDKIKKYDLKIAKNAGIQFRIDMGNLGLPYTKPLLYRWCSVKIKYYTFKRSFWKLFFKDN